MNIRDRVFQTYQLILFASLGTPLVTGGLGFYISGQGRTPPVENIQLLSRILIMAAALVPVLILGLKSFFLGRWEAAGQAEPGDILGPGIVLLALAEIPSMLGLISLILGVLPFSQGLWFFVGSIVCFLLGFIRKEIWDSLCRYTEEI